MDGEALHESKLWAQRKGWSSYWSSAMAKKKVSLNKLSWSSNPDPDIIIIVSDITAIETAI